jgi:hypothetical protein
MPKTYTPPQAFANEARPPIELLAVNSSQVKAIGYDPATKELAVTFTRGTGAIYHYHQVEPATFEAFKAAESIGGYFGQHIKALPFTKYAAEAEAAPAGQKAEA